MVLALKLNPAIIKGILNFKSNSTHLEKALSMAGYSQAAVKCFIREPGKLLWPELLSFFDGKLEEQRAECLTILSKLPILSDPGPELSRLQDLLDTKRLFFNLMLE